jgi:acyl carrier protein
MNQHEGLRAKVGTEMRSYIEENFGYLYPDIEITDDADLLGLGLIDSLGFVELVEEVQTRYGIRVSDEITQTNFGSVDSIATFVDGKLQQ